MEDIDLLRLRLTSSLRPMGVLWRHIAQEALTVHGISVSGGSALLFIGRLGEGVSHSALAEELGMEPASLVRIVDQLSQAGLLRREQGLHDRRVKTLWFTDAGRELTRKIETELVALRSRVLAPLSKADLEAALRVFHVLEQAAQTRPPNDPMLDKRHDRAAARRDWLFSARTFAAAMLALYIALALACPARAGRWHGLHRVPSADRRHPLQGGVPRVRHPAGRGGAVFVVPPLANEPVLLSLVVALWSGSLLYLSMLDHTPRHYLLRLPAYTMPLIALSAVYAPENVFDIAVARSEEIALGIVCASVVAALVLPTRVSAALSPRVDGWLRDAAAWATDTLGNAPQPRPRAATGWRPTCWPSTNCLPTSPTTPPAATPSAPQASCARG
ncbi:Salmolysin [Chromobacterium violaceum]|uniref:Salmolysin n=1 Tax=Chromobacterium violaceum TaxID=536 RepID=A0A3S4LJC1_CHRVL|nr:Salmolysin [Chromobacterium violaceum]